MTFKEYLQQAIAQLNNFRSDFQLHYDGCLEKCVVCIFYAMIPSNIAIIEAGLAAEEDGLCEDPTCINNLAYNVANAMFEEMDRRENA